MKWKIPPRIKVYEALGCIADKRIEISGNDAKVFSSARDKIYSVKYDGVGAIMCNDNGSYWALYLGYPAIAFLMLLGKIQYSPGLAESLGDVKWKELNVMFKGNYEKTESTAIEIAEKRGIKREELVNGVNAILEQIKTLNLDLLGTRTRPPRESDHSINRK